MENRLKIFSGAALKILAMLIMVVDHTGAIIFPQHQWFRVVGRLAFPIFAFFVAEGISYTRDINKYMIRMAVFALVTEVPFDLAFYGEVGFVHQNVMVTFFLAIAGIYAGQKFGNGNKYVELIGVLVAGVLAELFNTDYAWFGVLLVYLYYYLRKEYWQRHIFTTLFIVATSTGISRYAGFATLPLMLYNGKKGINLKYLFYAFYPVHLLILYFISMGI